MAAGLESALRELAAKMTGAPLEEIPNGLEDIVQFMADNTKAAGSDSGGEAADTAQETKKTKTPETAE